MDTNAAARFFLELQELWHARHAEACEKPDDGPSLELPKLPDCIKAERKLEQGLAEAVGSRSSGDQLPRLAAQLKGKWEVQDEPRAGTPGYHEGAGDGKAGKLADGQPDPAAGKDAKDCKVQAPKTATEPSTGGSSLRAHKPGLESASQEPTAEIGKRKLGRGSIALEKPPAESPVKKARPAPDVELPLLQATVERGAAVVQGAHAKSRPRKEAKQSEGQKRQDTGQGRSQPRKEAGQSEGQKRQNTGRGGSQPRQEAGRRDSRTAKKAKSPGGPKGKEASTDPSSYEYYTDDSGTGSTSGSSESSEPAAEKGKRRRSPGKPLENKVDTPAKLETKAEASALQAGRGQLDDAGNEEEEEPARQGSLPHSWTWRLADHDHRWYRRWEQPRDWQQTWHQRKVWRNHLRGARRGRYERADTEWRQWQTDNHTQDPRGGGKKGGHKNREAQGLQGGKSGGRRESPDRRARARDSDSE